MLHLLLACADHPTLSFAVDTSVLFAEPRDDFEDRARLAVSAPARLGAEGEVLEGEAVVNLAAVFDPGDEVGAIVDTGGVRYLAYFDRAHLTTVPATRTRVRGTPAGATVTPGFDPSEVGAWLPAGAAIQVTTLGPRFTRVSHDAASFRVDGWVPTGELDEVWAASPPLPEAPEPDTWLQSLATLHDAPGGAVFAEVDDVDWEQEPTGWVPATTLERRGDWRRVRVDDREVVLVGWVEEDDAEPVRFGFRTRCGFGCCGWGDGRFGSSAPPTVPVDTVLHDGVGGPPVARALRDHWFAATPSPLGGVEVEVLSPWGPVVLWAHPEAGPEAP